MLVSGKLSLPITPSVLSFLIRMIYSDRLAWTSIGRAEAFPSCVLDPFKTLRSARSRLQSLDTCAGRTRAIYGILFEQVLQR
jgi:hypothetical protein